MVAAGGAAMAVSFVRGDPKAIWLTLGYFTLMEALQATGYAVVDQCGTTANRSVTLLSYLHIAVQPIFINAFAMAIAPRPVSPRLRRAVYAVAALCSAAMILRLVPAEAFGQCQPGHSLCGSRLCLVSGEWHIGWEVPLNDLPRLLGLSVVQFPAYLLAVFVLPLVYGAWRLVLFHALAGPILASMLTGNPNEMPAIWCLFSIGIILIALSPTVRFRVFGAARPAAA
jgi:hypothetical protein